MRGFTVLLASNKVTRDTLCTERYGKRIYPLTQALQLPLGLLDRYG